jgi:hypothetical protein
MADVEAGVNAENLLENRRGENEAIRINIDDENDYRENCLLARRDYSLYFRYTHAKQRRVIVTTSELQ